MTEIIRRVATLGKVSLRAKDDDETEGEEPDELQFHGHAAVFNQPALIGSRDWGFIEWIEPGAFRDVLEDDVRFLFNHDGMPLARTTNGTLVLSEDKTGLFSEADLAPIQLSRDIATLVRRGDLTQMSFAFTVGEQRVGVIDEKHDLAGDFLDMPYRAVTRMSGLFDVSPVTYPAYEGTDAGMRFRKASDAEIEMIRGSITSDSAEKRYSVHEARERTRAKLLRGERGN